MARIELLTTIAAPRERCFDLARSVELHLHSAAGTSERVIGGRSSGLLGLGDEVTWRGRHFGLSLTLASRITAFDRPHHFRDSMVRGPLARLDHDHEFAVGGDGTTLMRDGFDFALPGGVFGRIAESLLVVRHFRRFLAARNHHLKAVAESGEWQRFLPDP